MRRAGALQLWCNERLGIQMSRITNDHGFATAESRWPRNLDNNDLKSLVTANELIQPIARVLQLLNNRFTATIISNIARSIYVQII